MSRRAQPGEMEFGSDSFLDIVANLVGVLIILIVIMGIRVGAQARENARRQREESAAMVAVVVEEKPVVPTVVSPPVPAGPTLEDLAQRQQQNARVEQANLSRRQQYDLQQQKQMALQAELQHYQQSLQQIAVMDQQVQTQMSAAQSALVETRQALQQLDESLSELQRREDELSGKVAFGQGKLKELDATTKAVFSKLLSEQSQTEAIKAEIARLSVQQDQIRGEIEEQFAAAQSHLAVLQKIGETPPAMKQITHQMTSMGAIVVKEEAHFRLLNGRISYVPVLELVELVKKDMEQNKDKLLKGEATYGTVGPINGYSLRYKASKQEISVVDELRMGGGMVRIGVNYWEVFDAGVDESEPYEIAKMPNSMFIDRVRAMNPNEKSVTMWVYPDSYDLYQQLRGTVEKAGLTVAARPLPAGIPIAGSPTGSKSLSQ